MKIRPATDDICLAHLQWRNDLRCTLQSVGGAPYYLVEDPLNGRFYRFGRKEWEWASRLDGRRTVRQIQAEASRGEADGGLEPHDQQCLARWLLQMQLAHCAGQAGSNRLPLAVTSEPQTAWWRNLLFLRIPLFNPDRFLARCLPWMAWSLTPAAFAVWLVFCLLALFTVWSQWDRFTASVPHILAADNWLWLLLAWMLLKAVHEFYHGLVCKKYGGYVPRCGLALILFSPVAFVDVTSSWRFRSKWQRVFTAAAGMYVELFVASVAALVWGRTESGLVSQCCHNLVTMAGVSTLLFNGNFLMRFDGYYILSDLLGFQNLYGAGQQYLHYVRRRYLLGLPAAPPSDNPQKMALIRIYAWATFVWRCLFYTGMLVVAASMFHGAGIVLAVLAGVSWFLLPAWRFVHYLCVGLPREQPQRGRFAAIVAGATLLLAGLLLLPWPGGVVAWGVVDYAPLSILRVRSPGFVRKIHVHAGQSVQPGQLLATIENPQTRMELAQLDLAIEQSQIRARVMNRDREVAEYQVELRQRTSLQKQRDELKQRVRDLEIRAPAAGRVIGRELETLEGQYLPLGAAVMSVGDEPHKQIQVSVAQADFDFFLRQLGCWPQVRIKGRSRPLESAQLSKINPRASLSLPHAALAAPNGGPLTVRQSAAATPGDTWELAEPHFVATVSLPQQVAQQMRAGELARVRLGASGESMGQRLWTWLQSRLHGKLKSRGMAE